MRRAQNITPQYTHKIKKKKKKQTGYTPCMLTTEDTIRHNIALMASTSKVYIPYPLGTKTK